MSKLDRRSFLTAAAGLTAPELFKACPAAAAVAGGGAASFLAKPATPLILLPPAGGYGAEAARITKATMDRFWDPNAAMFKAPVMSAEAVASDPQHNFGYVFWPSQIALHSLVEGAKTNPQKYAPLIWTVYSGLEKYFNTGLHAYTAWLYFPGNNDAYYDDNAWAVITLGEAYLATAATDPAHAAIYRNRAIDIMANFVYAGWDDTGNPGGERWGTDPTKPGTGDRTVSATAGAALGALTLARAGWNVAFNISWADSALSWIWTRLRDTDYLIQDGFQAPNFTLMTRKWTYNTGVTMRAYVEHHRLSQNKQSHVRAVALAKAVLDHRSRLHDERVLDVKKRFYNDHTYFVHFLIDGFLQVRQMTPGSQIASLITAECKREVNYAYNYIRDPADNLYWRNWRLWCIGATQLARWEAYTGQTITPQPDPAERSPDTKRLVKTLLANASASRLFWIAARL